MDTDVPDRIYLTGFMGSGKSTIAPLLADALAFDVYDLDAAIVSKVGRAISKIFDEDGEAEFRHLERELLEETPVRERCVISLGGGAVTFTSNLQFVQDHGFLVYLNVPVGILVDRLHGASDRPLLRDGRGALLTRAQLRDRISRMLSDRQPYYERADLIVDAASPTPDQTAARILSGLRG